MQTANITRTEAADRSQEIEVKSYEVELDLHPDAETFRSTTTARFEATATDTWLDLIAPRLISVTLNDKSLPISDFDGFRIQLTDLQDTNVVTVVADCAYMNTGEGLHRFRDPEDGEVYLYTQFETADARRMYACFEQPDLKATFQLSVQAPSHWQVISNSATPEPKPVGDQRSEWHFAPTPVMSTYITALVAGPYHVERDTYSGAGGVYPLGVFCRQSLADFLDAEEIFEITKQGFAFFEDIFQLAYPFGKYDQLFVPEFNAGAMENAGCVTFRDDYVFRSRVTESAREQRANTILHEMAHMWFGDLVTMKWWDDLWLNESFAEWAATFASVRATRFTNAWNSFAGLRKAWAYRQDQLPSTHPIAADMYDLDAVRVNFDGITYAKGASALKQLVAWVGETEFLSGLRNYFQEFAWQNTELSDLLGHLTATSGRDLSEWSAQWLQTSGVNLLRPVIEVADDGTFTSVTIVQEPPQIPPGLPQILRNHRIGIGLYSLVENGLEKTAELEVDIEGASTPVPQLTGVKQPDLLLLNDGDLTFAKIRLDEKSLSTVSNHIAQLEDALARTLIWGAAWDMTRDAEISVSRFVELVTSGITKEPDIAVVQTLVRQTELAIEQFAAPEHRIGYRTKLADLMWQGAEHADAGSDHQLAFLRAFVALAVTDQQLDYVSELLDGDRRLPGMTIDTELRWLMVLSLATAGRDADLRIETELERDATATGRRRAATARAARPTPEAKASAWNDMVIRQELPNAVLEATIAGFAQSGQEDLLAEFADRYFETVPQIWQQRTPETAATLTASLYPYLLVEPKTVAAADRLLANDSLHPSARRLVSEGRDSTLRAMRAQKLDSAE